MNIKGMLKMHEKAALAQQECASHVIEKIEQSKKLLQEAADLVYANLLFGNAEEWVQADKRIDHLLDCHDTLLQPLAQFRVHSGN